MSDIFRIIFIVAIVALAWRVLVWRRTKQRYALSRMIDADYAFMAIYKANTQARATQGALSPAQARLEWRAMRRAKRLRHRYFTLNSSARKRAR